MRAARTTFCPVVDDVLAGGESSPGSGPGADERVNEVRASGSPSTRAPLGRLGVAAKFVVNDDGDVVEVEPRLDLGRSLTASVALAYPDGDDAVSTTAAVEEARRGQRAVEVRLGVGPLLDGVPARLLGHAACISDTLKTDVPAMAGDPARVHIFSSAPIAGRDDASAMQSVAALGLALRLVGVDLPITVELADARDNAPNSLGVVLPPRQREWLKAAAENSRSSTDPNRYALAHSAADMFGDLVDAESAPLRVTVGALPEARFWAARIRVRAAALRSGLRIAPAFALVLKSLRVPWYHRNSGEPLLHRAMGNPIDIATALDAAANPAKGGNTGLKREARKTRPLMAHPGVRPLVERIGDHSAVTRLLLSGEFDLGPNIVNALGRYA